MRFLILYLAIFMGLANSCYSKELYLNNQVWKRNTLSKMNNNIDLCIFKPSRLTLSEDNKILIKGIPGNFVSFIYSKDDNGDDFQTIDGKINDNGFVELNLNLDLNKFKDGDNLYFKLVSWSDKDHKDLKEAKIYGIDGQITNLNKIEVVKKIKNSSIPMFSPAIDSNPINNSGINDTINAIKGINDNNYDETNYSYPKTMFYDKPAMFMNINAPEMLRK